MVTCVRRKPLLQEVETLTGVAILYWLFYERRCGSREIQVSVNDRIPSTPAPKFLWREDMLGVVVGLGLEGNGNVSCLFPRLQAFGTRQTSVEAEPILTFGRWHIEYT